MRSAKNPNNNSRITAVCVLAALVLAVFFQCTGFAFLNWDDDHDVFENPHIRSGISGANFVWAWTTLESGHWIPLTRISHQLDFSLHGMDPGAHHTVNLLLHLATVILVFFTLDRISPHRFPAAMAAAWFAIHPMRSESVAWVVERKDCLSGLFAALTLFAYVRYTEKPTKAALAKAVSFFVLGLLSKGSVAPLAVCLLLLDYWPLKRSVAGWRALWLEKIPFLIPAVLAGLANVYARELNVEASPLHTGATLYDKVANLSVSYAFYLRDTFLPYGLSALYPFESGVAVWQTVLAAALLGGITAAAWLVRHTAPWFAAGWLWFFLLILPFSGLTQDGIQSRADRYTYLAHILFFFAIFHALYGRFGDRIRMPAYGVTGVLLFFGYVNTAYWKDSVTLFARSIETTGPNNMLVTNLGLQYMRMERYEEARKLFETAIEHRARDRRVYLDLAELELRASRPQQALAAIEKVHQHHPGQWKAYQTQGAIYRELKRREEAIEALEKAVELAPTPAGKAETLTLRGEYYILWERYGDAEKDFRRSLSYTGLPHVAQRNLGNALYFQDRYEDAIREYDKHLAYFPNDRVALAGRSEAMKKSQQKP